jgi:phenylacetate-coenzyme A ligase PaaK-like adenylate-forming protein
VIERIEGRQDDVCYFPATDGKGEDRPFFPDTLRRMVLLAHPDIADYQVVQERPGHIRVHLEVRDGNGSSFDAVAEAVRGSVARVLAEYGCRATTVEVERGVPPPVRPGASVAASNDLLPLLREPTLL